MTALLLALALAAPCEGPYRVAGGRLYDGPVSEPVRSAHDAHGAASALRACGREAEAEALLEWRTQTRRAWVSGVAGVVLLVPWAWTPGHIARARSARETVAHPD